VMDAGTPVGGAGGVSQCAPSIDTDDIEFHSLKLSRHLPTNSISPH
jgi:hypothetical protein